MKRKKVNKLVMARFNSLETYKRHAEDSDLEDALKLVPLDMEVFRLLGVESHLVANGGYVKFGELFGGLILQWGEGTENQSISFPVVFPNEVAVVLVTNSHRDGKRYGVSVIRRNQTGFYVQVGDDNVGECTFSWLAIGF